MTSVPCSLGEIFDKISILEIKSINLKSLSKLNSVRSELLVLRSLVEMDLLLYEHLYFELLHVNKKIWIVVDRQYSLEKQGTVDTLEFAKISYEALNLNRIRFMVKAKINSVSGSEIAEQKQFGD